MDIEKIKQILPHRYPILMVDRVLELIPNKSCKAIKNVTINEPQFQGHFPDFALFPGIYQIEAIAQVGGLPLINGGTRDKSVFPVLAKVKEARFKKYILPGDCLIIETEIIKYKSGIAQVKGKVTSTSPDRKDFVATLAEITLAIPK